MHCYFPFTEGIIVKGTIINSDQEYVVLMYEPRYRGNLNFDGFRSIGTRIDEKGNFILSSEKVTHAAYYSLQLDNQYLPLILFKGDNINLELDFDDLYNSLFAIGPGAGKINVLNLKQFEYFPFEPEWTIEEFNFHTDSIISMQLSILDAIYSKELGNIVVSNAINKSQIQRIIKESPLSVAEYEFLKKRVLINKYYAVDFISGLSNNKMLDSTLIDFTNPIFSHFNENEYNKIDNINDWHFGNTLDRILYAEFLKNKQKENPKLTYKNWDSYLNTSLYIDWVSSNLKRKFNTEVFDKYYADILGWILTLGDSDEDRYEYFSEQCTNIKYLNRIDEFKGLLDNCLNNPEYNLDASNLSLNDSKFNSLIESYKGKSIYIVFWSAQFAGSSIIKNLPVFKDFEKTNENELVVVNICIDKAEYENLWAARIIDNSWKSTHYFMPIEGNDSTLNKFSSKKISSFCEGGATYTIIDKEGNVYNEVEAPIGLTKDEIERYLN